VLTACALPLLRIRELGGIRCSFPRERENKMGRRRGERERENI